MKNQIHSSAIRTPAPIVGIPIPGDYFRSEPLWGNAGGYRAVNEIVDAVKRAGGEAKLMFPGDENTDFQALILPGGGDVDPTFYGQQATEYVEETDLELDAFQLRLTRRALQQDLPILGICRGMQVMNVAAGGTLVQHLESTEEHFPEEAKNDPDLRSKPVHPITLTRGSHLEKMLGQSRVDVNSLHHQATDLVPASLRITGRSGDGVVEAIEGPGRFQVGVQFHPEDLRHEDTRFQELFALLVSHT